MRAFRERDTTFALFLSLFSIVSTIESPPTAVEAAVCRFPGAPAHSIVTVTGYNPGDIATYSCERGFELLGPSRRICGSDGNWTPDGIPFCVLNVAAGKAPMQVSTEGTGAPQRAVDGSTSAVFAADTCTLTRPERRPWWYVNLLEPYMVQLVRLDFGRPCCGKKGPATVVVRVGNNRPDLATNPVCNRFTGQLEEGKPLFLPCNPPMPGAFVSVHLDPPAGAAASLSLCETFVYTDQALPIERCPQFRDQPPGSTATYNGKCYAFYNRQPLPFRDALTFCRARGGSLVDESNPALQGFISWELWRRHRTDSSSQYWMGAVRDAADRSNWKWVSGEDVTVSFWNLPGGNEDCARYDGSKGWLWSDTKCTARINYICQHQPKACGRPEQPPNSTMVAGSFDVGASVEYTCDEGHLLIGPSARRCLPTGFYDEFPPVCKRIVCGYPAEILNGRYELINGTVSYLSQVEYRCDDGYRIQGRARLTCDLDERWDGPPPRCHPTLCPEPPAVLNGEMFVSNNVTVAGTVVEYSCSSPRHSLVGAKRLVCLPDGSYDHPPPSCTEDRERPVIPTRPTLVTAGRPPGGDIPTPERPRERPRPFAPPISTTPSSEIIDNRVSQSAPIPQVVVASGRPADSRGSESVRADILGAPGRRDDRTTLGAKLNLGAIIALGVFGGFVFLAAVVTTIVILIKRNRRGTHLRHRASPDCHTVASLDSSGSESRGGLSRYYRQAWENLQEATRGKADEAEPGKRRHHHHHHHHHHRHNDWRQQTRPGPQPH